MPCPAQARTCDACTIQLARRTGPYSIIASKASTLTSPTNAPLIRVTIVNPGPAPLHVGGPSHVVLNFVGPLARGRESVHLPSRPTDIQPGSRWTFETTFPYELRRPGVYTFNISLGLVDSNILTYKVP